MEKVEQYQQDTEQIMKQLSLENKKYFTSLVGYLKTAGFFYDETEVYELISQLAGDLLDAQTDGQSAEEFLGSQPKEMADELIKQFDKRSYKKQIKATVLITLAFLVVNYSAYLGDSPFKINLVEYLGLTFISLLLASVSFTIVHRLIFLPKKSWLRKIRDHYVLSFLVNWLLFCVIIGGMALFIYALRQMSWYHSFTITLPMFGEWLILLLVLLSVTLIVVSKKIKNFYYVLPVLYISSLSGIIKSLFFQNQKTMASVLVPLIAMLVALLAFFLFLAQREKKRAKN